MAERGTPRRVRILQVGALVVASLAFAIGVLEVGARVLLSRVLAQNAEWMAASEGVPALRDCDDCSYVFGLNPEHPEFSAQGFRDRELSPEPAEGRRRIAVLGDSVAFGFGVPNRESLPRRLEEQLTGRDGLDGTFEVVNAGVYGYTAYNELHYYVERLRSFRPDVVLLVVCLNDVVDPYLHWTLVRNYRTLVSGRLPDPETVPAAAIPNPERHDRHVLPLADAWMDHVLRDLWAPLRVSTLARLVWRQVAARSPPPRVRRVRKDHYERVDGMRWPVLLTIEDSLSIEVLTERDSPEWRWLADVYDRLIGEVEQDGAELVLVVAPLGYQLDPDYPYLPQSAFAEYCAERQIACVDLLPVFRDHADGAPLYIGREPDPHLDDVWHFSPRGNEVAAKAVADFLEAGWRSAGLPRTKRRS